MWGASTMHLAGSGNALFLFPSGVAFSNGPQRQTLHQPAHDSWADLRRFHLGGT